MKLNAYSIYDTASGSYSRPFFANADGQAVREFSDLATNTDHPVGAHPEDYSLHRIGLFDDQKGQFTPEQTECMATALELVALSKNVTPIDKQKAGLTD